MPDRAFGYPGIWLVQRTSAGLRAIVVLADEGGHERVELVYVVEAAVAAIDDHGLAARNECRAREACSG